MSRALRASTLLLIAACTSDAVDRRLPRAALLDPATCRGCHPTHYEQWSSSMHAYASEDPVFLAMNRRGQEEAQLGDFCVRCHAPMAVIEGATTDGLNLDEVPKTLQGVTCYFCHNAVDVEGDHGNMLKLANDSVMRGGIRDAVDPEVHGAAYSEFHDRNSSKSSRMCGSCHDFFTPNGVFLERTFAEYRDTIFATTTSGSFDSCQGCHMDGQDGVVANVPGVPARRIHEHIWPGVDVALSDFPHREAMRAAVEECALRNSIQYFGFEFDDSGSERELGRYVATLETSAGHKQPSGAAQDRRMWLEVIAYDDADKVIFQSGVVPDGAYEDPSEDSGVPIWMFHERVYDADGEPAHMFWDVAPSERYPDGFVERALPGPRTLMRGAHSLSFTYQLPPVIPRRVEFWLRLRPVGFEVLQSLVDSKHLDPAVLAEMPTFTVYGAVAEWPAGTSDPNPATITPTTSIDCKRYRCLYDPNSDGCE